MLMISGFPIIRWVFFPVGSWFIEIFIGGTIFQVSILYLIAINTINLSLIRFTWMPLTNIISHIYRKG